MLFDAVLDDSMGVILEVATKSIISSTASSSSLSLHAVSDINLFVKAWVSELVVVSKWVAKVVLLIVA